MYELLSLRQDETLVRRDLVDPAIERPCVITFIGAMHGGDVIRVNLTITFFPPMYSFALYCVRWNTRYQSRASVQDHRLRQGVVHLVATIANCGLNGVISISDVIFRTHVKACIVRITKAQHVHPPRTRHARQRSIGLLGRDKLRDGTPGRATIVTGTGTLAVQACWRWRN